MKSLFLTLFLLSFKLTSQLDSIFDNKTVNQVECLIHSQQFKFEYLLPIISKRQLSTYPLENFYDFDQIRWVLYRTVNNSFYIKSSMKDYFFCASQNEFADGIMFSKYSRQKVKMIELNQFINDARLCKWIFKKHESNHPNTYTIWNEYFNKPFFASYFAMNIHYFSMRHVFLWHQKPDSNQFYWIIDCTTGHFLTS
jgi:hypothetical protein